MEPINEENGTVRDDGLVETENGALAFASHPSPFADFFFKVSSMRQWDADAKPELNKAFTLHDAAPPEVDAASSMKDR